MEVQKTSGETTQTVAKYVYDPDGNRIWAEYDDGTSRTYHFDLTGQVTENPIMEAPSAGPHRNYIYLNRRLLARVDGTIEAGKKYWFMTDHLGSARGMADAAGNVVWKADYEAFGKAKGVWDDGTVTEVPRFTGKAWDEHVGLYYFNARWYDAGLGRFVGEDPAKANPNAFSYAKNRPLTICDPTGMVETPAAFSAVDNGTAGGAVPKIIVIDIGHVGGAGGTEGRTSGVEEEVVNIAVANSVVAELTRMGYQVIVTTGTLDDRVEKANDANADLFVSIHANSIVNASRRGIEIVIPNNHDVEESGALGDSVMESMLSGDPALHESPRGVYEDDRGLVVLTDTQMPAIIVEVGYMSNTADEAYLNNIGYAQERSMEVDNRSNLGIFIAQGIDSYINGQSDAQGVSGGQGRSGLTAI